MIKRLLLSTTFALSVTFSALAQGPVNPPPPGTAGTIITKATIAELKALTTRPSIVEVIDANPGIFNLSNGACSAADDIFQVQPTAGTTVCYTRMATPYAIGKMASIGTLAATANLTALKAITLTGLTAGTRAYRAGYTTAGDGGDAVYVLSLSACSLNAGAGDNGSQVAPNAGTGCWIAVLPLQADVRVWGADPTDSIDSASAFQAALTWSDTATGACVGIPNGVFKLNTAIAVTGWSCLQGNGWSENIPGIHVTYGGSWLHITQTAAPAFTLTTGTARGNIFNNFGMIQDHPAVAPGWAPTVYQPVFFVSNTLGEARFENLFFGGVYQGIYSLNAGRTTIKDVRGQTFSYMVFMDNTAASDTNYADGVHIWPYWSSSANVLSWQQTNGTVFKYGRVDSVQSDHIFALGYKSCVSTVGNVTGGPATGIYVGSLNCDASRYAFEDTDTTSVGLFGYSTDINISNLHCGGITSSNCVQLAGKYARVKIDQVTPVGITGSIINITDTSATPGAIVQLGKINASGASVQFNSDGVSPAVKAVAKTGIPHQISISNPVVPSNGGYTAAGITSGIISAVLTTGAPLIHDAGNQTWLSTTVTNGGTLQIPNWVSQVFAAGSGITSTTYALPDFPIDGMTVTVTASANQTGVTFTSAAGLVNQPTSLAPGQGVTMQYVGPASAWVRRR